MLERLGEGMIPQGGRGEEAALCRVHRSQQKSSLLSSPSPCRETITQTQDQPFLGSKLVCGSRSELCQVVFGGSLKRSHR